MTTILVIDDDDAIRLNLVDILTLEGFETLAAENGAVGVELALRHRPDAIICDVMMPELDGWAVLRRLQAERSTATIPFIFLTAKADRESMRYGMELGADDYITKPFTPPELVGAIRSRLAKHRSAVDTFREQFIAGGDVQAAAQGDLSGGARDLVGATVRGYQIWELVGEGGVGVVYRAYQPSLGRDVAIKVLRERYASNSEFLQRFQTEAELIARLEHPHIIPLYDYWIDSNRAYIVMRWLRRGSLRTTLEEQGRWEVRQTAHLLQQVADALALAHSAGIVHRDLKPDNILLDERGNAYLTDFGLAKQIASGAFDALLGNNASTLLETQKNRVGRQPFTALDITDPEELLGTPEYLSPEQILSEPVSPQSDIYSLGITLYEMLTGRRPFAGNLGDVIFSQIAEELPSIHAQRADVPNTVDRVIQKATAKEAQNRHPDVLALAADYFKACRYTH